MRILSIALCSLVFASEAGALTFTITDLGFLAGGTSSGARALNEKGQVAGDASTATGAYHGFFWDPGTGMADIGALPGGSDESDAAGINNLGEVVGSSIGPGDYSTVVWQATGGLTDLGASIGGDFNFGLDINDLGQVVGQAYVGGSALISGYVLDPAAGLRLLPSPTGGFSSNTGINNHSEAVGWGDVVGETHALYWAPAGGVTDLGALIAGGAPQSEASAINDFGKVVGWSYDANYSTSSLFLWDGLTGMFDLGGLPGWEYSYALDINDHGQVLGYTLNADGSLSTSFLWDDSSGFTDLASLIDPATGWSLFGASAINNRGQIAGTALLDDTESHALMLTPTAAQVPLPGGLFLMGSVLAGLAVRRRKSRASCCDTDEPPNGAQARV